MKTWKYARLFLDTNTLVKWLAPDLKESGTKELEEYLEIGMRIHTSNYCIGEALGVLKAKWLRKEISKNGYLMIINRLNWKMDHKKIVLHKLQISEKFPVATQLVEKYRIDYIDALLLDHAIHHSKDYDLFVTADDKLYKAAKASGVTCWNVIKTKLPPYC